MVAQAAVVGLQVVARHILLQPYPWTEEIARLLLVWLMCAGGIAALQHGQHPRVTALVRLFSAANRQAIDRGLRLVLLAFLLWLVGPAWRLTMASAGERLAASGLSGAIRTPCAIPSAPPASRWHPSSSRSVSTRSRSPCWSAASS